MIRVLIAKDELLVRIGIASSVPWASLVMRLVGETGDGEAAWRVCESDQPHLVIMDIRMPRLDGVGLLSRIRTAKMPCAVIVITNVESGPQIEAARRMGVSKVLMKAVLPQEDIVAAAREVGEEIRDWDDLPEWEPTEPAPLDNALGGAVTLQSLAQARPPLSGLLCVWIGASAKEPLKRSLIQMIIHQLGRPDNFYCLPTPAGAILLPRRALEDIDMPPKAGADWPLYRGEFLHPSAHGVAGDAGGRRALEILGENGGDFEGLDALIGAVSSAVERRMESLAAGITEKTRGSMDYIAAHLREDLSVQRLADEAGYHPVYFSNRFKKETGVSYSDYLTRLRIARAMRLMARTNLTIQEVALQCGFADRPYFSNRFKRMVDVPPGQSRRGIFVSPRNKE